MIDRLLNKYLPDFTKKKINEVIEQGYNRHKHNKRKQNA